MSQSPDDVEFIFRSYQVFEQKLLDIFQVFPLSKENETAWSPELVNLFLDINSLLDSVSRDIISKGVNSNHAVQVIGNKGSKISKPVRDLNIEDFEINLFSGLKLLDYRIIVYMYPLLVLTPYKNYRIQDNGWWDIYNKLKHNRIKNYNKANIINTLNALAGLFLFLVKYKSEEFSKALTRFKWVKSGGLKPEFVHEGRSTEPYMFWYESELFGTHEIPENIPDDLSIITPSLTSDKFQRFFGRFNSN